MEKKIVDIDAYAMGWDQFLHTAYSFVKAERWDDFDAVDFIRDGKPFDIQPFKANLIRLMTFADFQSGKLVPMQALRDLPTDRIWEGLVNIGSVRRKQQDAMKHIGKLIEEKRLHKRVDYFTMRPANTPEETMQSFLSRNRPHMLILAFEDIEDLVYTKMTM